MRFSLRRTVSTCSLAVSAAGEGFGLLVARATLAEECLSRAEAASAAALARTPEAPRLQTAKLRVAVDALLKMAKRDNQLVCTASVAFGFHSSATRTVAARHQFCLQRQQ